MKCPKMCLYSESVNGYCVIFKVELDQASRSLSGHRSLPNINDRFQAPVSMKTDSLSSMVNPVCEGALYVSLFKNTRSVTKTPAKTNQGLLIVWCFTKTVTGKSTLPFQMRRFHRADMFYWQLTGGQCINYNIYSLLSLKYLKHLIIFNTLVTCLFPLVEELCHTWTA